MDTSDLLQRLSVSLAIGLLIGIERGWQARDHPEGGRTAGLRTNALAGLLGGTWGALAATGGDNGLVALALAFTTLSATIAAFRYRETARDGTFGATTVVAAMLSFSLGAFAVLGDIQVAGAAGIAAAALLALKGLLHGWIMRLTWNELRSGLVLLAMTFILLPLLPNRTVDPWDAVNPFEFWLLTIMIAAISFAGYVAVRLAGERSGIVITGIAGGLASSTAVTLALARLARVHPDRTDLLAAGALFAGATMMMRVLVIAALASFGLLSRLAVPIVAAALVLAIIGAVLLRRQTESADGGEAIRHENPFELLTVLKFGLLLTLISVGARLATTFAGSAGAYLLAALSGIGDVDALTLSMARLAGRSIDFGTATVAVLIAVAVNTVAKAVLSWTSGGAAIGVRLSGAAAAALAAGALAAGVAAALTR
jgi:uncharacterized membrane protein (DUF4010 family)